MTQQIHSQRPVGLEARRLALGLSRERLAAKADGMSSATIRRAERGDTVPHPRTVAALAKALGCRPEDIDPINSDASVHETEATPSSGTHSRRATV
jgi:transcriptional regulator with XRE-family HTH domain